ncbi:hypothetical protein OAK08_00755 [Candidatus Pelagibacter sp.]|jgi:hypothetical protein|nr:hypothetical protein [Candidatus Pelagibacter sp.]|tara:strand:+ start:114 stop:302 length:189 start_codon:yes stop_codon:yes gene_type:complete
MSNTFLISLIIPIKIILIYLIISYFRKKKTKEKEQTSEAIERMQIREYGKKINDETRSKRSK